jgi:transposase
LTNEEHDQFVGALHRATRSVGYNAPAWPPELARQYLLDEFDTDYTLRHVRRKIKDAGLSWQTPRPQPSTVEEEELEEFRKDLEKPDSNDS